MKKILVTGASGFVGYNLIPFLKSNYSISTIGRKTSNPDYSWDDLDGIRESSKAIIHLAGKAHDVHGSAKAQDYIDINLGLTKKVFNLFLKSDSEVFIYFSSVKAVASVVEGILKEEDEFQVDNPYGASKRAAEEFLLSKTLKPNQRLYIIRPCMIHGPGNKGNLNLLFQMAKKSIPFPFGAYENERSLLGIENLNHIILSLLEKMPEAGVYNLADDDYISTTEIYRTMGMVLNKKLSIVNTPKSIIKFIGKVGDKTPLPIDSLKILKLTENYRVSNTKIKIALGIKRMPYSLKDNLIKTIESFKN